MKRDRQLIKALLLEIESREPGHYFVPEAFAGHEPESVKHHLLLMHQAGLVECELDHPWDGEPVLIAHHLTLLGHDLLDGLREDEAAVARESLRRIA
jgi:hypothetical protein